MAALSQDGHLAVQPVQLARSVARLGLLHCDGQVVQLEWHCPRQQRRKKGAREDLAKATAADELAACEAVSRPPEQVQRELHSA